MADFDELPDAVENPADPMGDFASWIPRYSKPEHPCDYCRSHHLECFLTFENQRGCSPCNALFRACSFGQPRSRAPRGAIDTLHVVDEDVCTESGRLTKYKHLRSLGGPGVDTSNDPPEERPSGAKSGARFSRQAVKILRDWIEEHSHHPYPTEDEKEELRIMTGLSTSQVSNWLANARRRGKARPRRAPSPNVRSPTGAIDIQNDGLPSVTSNKEWTAMNPFERWRHSPPENEPAPVYAIKHAMSHVPFEDPSHGNLEPSPASRHHSGENSSVWSHIRAPSSTSLDTSFVSTASHSGSHHSHGSGYSRESRSSYQSFGSMGKKQKRRRRVPIKPTKSEKETSRLFQCTFCTDTFKSKYDWARHEKSLHISLEKWICAPYGGIVVDPNDGQRKCAFCAVLNPSVEHLEEHNFDSCESKGIEARSFYRKDHLRQHLRLMHNCEMTPVMEHWKSELANVASRCGFCGERFTKWQVRVDHLTKHFRSGAKMKDWKGCRGLDPTLAAQVTNSMPPFLIAQESTTMRPFSATRGEYCQFGQGAWLRTEASQPESSIPTLLSGDDQSDLAGIETLNLTDGMPEIPANQLQLPRGRRKTCWEILTINLGTFVRDFVSDNGVVPTDEQLQNQARRIIYDSDDPWNQTSADNTEWLRLFKRAHNIDTGMDSGFLPTGPASREEKADLLEDLGIGAGIDLDDLCFDTEFPLTTTGPDQQLPSFPWRESGVSGVDNGPVITTAEDMVGFTTFS